jgi:coenzyme F420-reducing hydrogenase beta subunit
MDDQKTIHDIAVYAAYCNNKEVLKYSASGGIAAALCIYTVKKGGYIAGVTYTDDYLDAEYILTNDLKDISRIQGSKYIKAKTNNIYIRVKEKLEDGEHVLFTGLPCNVAALKSVLKKDYENLITCELICNGPTKTQIHREYIKHLEEKYDSTISSFSVRYKKFGWPTPYLRAVFRNGKVFEEQFYSTEYGYAFRLCGYDGCYQCKYKGDNRAGDLMIGDFWGAGKRDCFWNRYGVSAVLVHTEKANQLLKSVDCITLFDSSFERVVSRNKRIMTPLARTHERDRFNTLLDEVGLFAAVKQVMPTKRRVKMRIKAFTPPAFRWVFEKFYDFYNTNSHFK